MEIMFARLFEIFSIEFIFIVIMASYTIIKIVDALNGKRIVPTWLKRTITFGVGTVAFFVFKEYTDTSVPCLLSSYFAAVFLYDTAIKFLLKKLRIDYKKDDK